MPTSYGPCFPPWLDSCIDTGGSEILSASLPEGVLTVSFEIGARIVVQAGGNGLGSRAKASFPVRVAWPSAGEKEKSVLCIIQRPNRAPDNLRGAGIAGRPREASNASAAPNRPSGGGNEPVHGLFRWLFGLVACIALAGGLPVYSIGLPVRVEIGARIVVQAGGNGLGSRAKASFPVRVAWPSYVPPVW
ncbi:hypothetical protein [Tsuneonella troitsensis]|uniref:hypothetical protein n=1 Tax=Tsuneonella troitsensis TaxID=292222 RepID=UPI00128F8ECA|nr:hypothetical protein [Tsuneonella troitsensis]